MEKFLEINNSQFKCVAVSGDGEFFAAGSNDTSVRVWNGDDKKLYACLMYHKDTVNCVAFSNSSYLATGSDDKTVALWDVQNKSIVSIFRGHNGSIKSLCFCRNYKFIASGSGNEIFLWELNTEECKSRICVKDEILCGIVSSYNWFYAGIGSRYEIWDLILIGKKFSSKAHSGPILSITQSISKKYTITGSSDNSINIWLNSSNSLYASLVGHKSSVTSLCITPDDESLISGSLDNKIILWNISSKANFQNLKIHNNSINSLAYKNNFIYSASDDCRIGISKHFTDKFELKFEWHSDLNTFTYGTLSFKDSVTVYGKDNILLICKSTNYYESYPLIGHASGILATCISNNLKSVLSCSWGSSKNLILWDLEKCKMIRNLDGHLDSVFCVDILGSGKIGLSGDKNGIVIAWDLETGKQIVRFEDDCEAIIDVRLNESGNYAAFLSENDRLVVISLKSKYIHCNFDLKTSKTMKLLSSNDSNSFLAVSLYDGVQILDIDKRRLYKYSIDIDESKERQEIFEDLIENFSFFRLL